MSDKPKPETDDEIIQMMQSVNVRCKIVPSEVEPYGRELQVRVYADGHNLYGEINPMRAQLDGDWGSPKHQIHDDLTNNGEIDDETLIRAFGVEYRDGESEQDFEDRRERIENAVAAAVMGAVHNTLVDHGLGPRA